MVPWVDAGQHRISRRILTCPIDHPIDHPIRHPIPSRCIIRLGRTGAWRRCITGTLLICGLRLDKLVQIDFEVATVVLHPDGQLIGNTENNQESPSTAEVAVINSPIEGFYGFFRLAFGREDNGSKTL